MDVRLYADEPWVRLRQVAGDALVLVLSWLVVRTAMRLAASIRELGVVGDGLDRSGRTVDEAATLASEAVQSVPVLGDVLAAPLRQIGVAGSDLSAAGVQVESTVDTIAFWVPAILIGLVLGWVLLRYLPGRITWMREATQVQRLLAHPDATQLLGVRAAASRPLRTLCREVGDPAAAVAEGRWAELAAVELRALGLDRQRVTPAEVT